MSGVNVQVSVANLPQFDRHQSEVHRAPLTNQEQNTDIARADAVKRVLMPVEPEKADGKNVDPEAKRHEKPPKGKKRRKPDDSGKKPRPRSGGGYFVDVEA